MTWWLTPHTVTISQVACGLTNLRVPCSIRWMVFKQILQGPKLGSKWQGCKRAQIPGLILGLLAAIKGSKFPLDLWQQEGTGFWKSFLGPSIT